MKISIDDPTYDFPSITEVSEEYIPSRKRFNSLASTYQEVWHRARIKLRAMFLLQKTFVQHKYESKKSKFLDINSNISTDSQSYFMQSELPKYMFHPDSAFKNCWNVYMSILMIYTAIIMPYTLAFFEYTNYDVWSIIDILLDISFFIDIFINLNSSAYHTDGTLIKSYKEIFFSYAKTWLIIDIFSCIPFGLIGSVQNSSQNYSGDNSDYKNILKLLRLPKLYRIFRIFKIFKIVTMYRQSMMMEKIQDFLNLTQSGVRLLTSCFTIVISIHIMSCFWFYAAKIEGFNPKTWVTLANLQDSDIATLYITALYWTTTTFCTVGYGDIEAGTILEKNLAMFWMIFSVCYFSYVIGSLTTMFETVNTKSNFLMNKLAIIDNFANEAKLNKQLRTKIKTALKYANKKTFLSIKERDTILNELPSSLKHEVSIAMHGQAASKLFFFKNKDAAIISAIIPYLQPVFFDQGEIVYSEGEYSEGIYFIIEGLAAYFNKKCNNKFIKSIKCGEHFGDIEYVLKSMRKYSVKAINNTESLKMGIEVIQKFKEEYFLDWEKMKNEAKEKNKELIKRVLEIKLLKKISIDENFDKRKYQVNYEAKLLKQNKFVFDKRHSENKDKVTIPELYHKIEDMNIKLYNIQHSISTFKQTLSHRTLNRRNTIHHKHRLETQDTISESAEVDK